MKRVSLSVCVALIVGCGGGGGGGSEDQSNRQEFAGLGKKIFFDTTLSSPQGQSCATCHASQGAFADPAHTAVSKGAVSGARGTRNSPTAMYALYSPAFGFSDDEGDFVGGQFWDGRAADLEAQAKEPFFNSHEMNLFNTEALRQRIANAPYVQEFEALYGADTLSDPEATLLAVANAIAAFENSAELRPFSSKYDAWAAGQVLLSEQEKRGLALFNAPNKGNCAACHLSLGADGSAREAIFTDFTYDNIGLPKNSAANSQPDIGLYKTTGRPSDIGRFKVPTLRNVEITAPYFHNGIARTLKETVHFYNARDVSSPLGSPEFPDNMNIVELGNLGLSSQEEDDIVAFLRTLTDGFATATP